MPDGKKTKHILLVEDNEQYQRWCKQRFDDMKSNHNAEILVINVSSFQEVEEFVQKVKSSEGKEKVDCVVVDMQIWQHKSTNRTSEEKVSIHWGWQAFREIQTILELDEILIVTAYKGNVLPYLSDPEKKRIKTKDIHPNLFEEEVISCWNWRSQKR